MAASLDMKINARVLAALASLLAGAAFIAMGTLLLPEDTTAREIFFGYKIPGLEAPYPVTIQNLMWLMFFIGCGEIWTRIRQAGRDLEPVNARLLPEDPESMLRAAELGPIYRRVNTGGFAEDAFLPRLINRTILQFQSSRSVDQANSLLNSTLELCQHEIELRYNMLRYLVWLLPTLGFIGTVIGIAFALKQVSGVENFNDPAEMADMMPRLIKELGVAFYTTLLALLQSAILVFTLHIAQAREERGLNRAGQYCLDNLINRLYDK